MQQANVWANRQYVCHHCVVKGFQMGRYRAFNRCPEELRRLRVFCLVPLLRTVIIYFQLYHVVLQNGPTGRNPIQIKRQYFRETLFSF